MFLVRLEKLYGDAIEKAIEGIASGEVTGLDAARVLGSLQGVLERAGLTEYLGRLKVLYGRELEFVIGTFDRLGRKGVFSEVDKQTIDALIQFDTDRVASQLNEYVDDVKSSLMRSVIIGEKPDFEPLRDQLGGRVFASLETESNTALMGFSRTVTVSKALEVGFEKFEYIGPDDKITREFCLGVLHDRTPPIYTVAEIEAMDNDQGLPAFQYCGGYNCRHQWIPA